jgi:hypothetical protein
LGLRNKLALAGGSSRVLTGIFSMEMPTMQEFFDGDYQRNWLRNSMPLERPRRFAQPYYTRPLAGYSQDVIRPLLRPQEVPGTVINHPNTVGSRSAVSTIPAV